MFFWVINSKFCVSDGGTPNFFFRPEALRASPGVENDRKLIENESKIINNERKLIENERKMIENEKKINKNERELKEID